MQIGMIGLGRMGSNMVRRLMRGGHECVVYDLNSDNVNRLEGEGAAGAESLDEFAKQLGKPRAVWVMVPAGTPTEQTVMALAEKLEAGDTIIDGGNSYYKDDIRRAKALRPKGIHYVDAGTSGGLWGLERGYCLMLGGEEEVVRRLEDFRVILLPVEATIPRPQTPEEKAAEAEPEESEQDKQRKQTRISREELYQDIEDSARVTKIYMVAVVLSSLVAAIGIVRGNIAVIIGAMVIAPLLGPNVALALGTTLADFSLVRRSLKANAIGVAVAFAGSVLLGLLVAVDPSIPEIASRTEVGLSDIALALASGASGALAFTTGISTAVIGVMVAVALLPPLVTCGLLVGAGYWGEAFGAFLLVATNVICVNLSGVVTFLMQGVQPSTWWEADRARRATWRAIGLWLALLAALVILVLWTRAAPGA